MKELPGACSFFECMILEAYEAGRLDKDFVRINLNAHRGTKMDYSEILGELTHDGLDCMTIVLKTLGKPVPEDKEGRMKSFKKLTARFGWR